MPNAVSIVDSHLHFWDPEVLRYAWLEGFPSIRRRFGPEEWTAASSGLEIGQFIFVQADCAHDQGLAEVEWVVSLADPRLAGIVAFAPLERGRAAKPMLEALASKLLVKGIRRLIQGEAEGFARRADFQEGVRLLAEFGFSFDLCLKHHQLGETLELVAACPKVSFVLDHIAKPDIRQGLRQPWEGEIAALAKFPNVSCKISGMITEADWQHWTSADLRPYLDHVLECFGEDRLLFGGDWPVLNLAGAYQRWFQEVQQWTSDWPNSAAGKFYRENARRIYRF